MTRINRLLLFTFIESFATILIERGVYFYTDELLKFTNRQNLLLAFAFGVVYAVAALLSHRLARRLGEKRLLALVVAGQCLSHLVMCLFPASAVLVAGDMGIALCNGLKWPVVESYISAGRTPLGAAPIIGRFNLAWSISVPLAMFAAGPLIGSGWPWLLFALPALVNLVSLVLIIPLPRVPEHLAVDHPDRLAPAILSRYRLLTSAARWSMLSGYCLLFVLAPLMPTIFGTRLNYSVAAATALAGITDVARVAAFVLMMITVRWHGRRYPLLAGTVLMPLGFLAAMYGPDVTTVIIGEIIFGAAAGVAYHAALYYALVVANAAVAAGGEHEGLIGAGFALGPLAALLGQMAGNAVGRPELGILIGVAPIILIGLGASLVPLARVRPPAV
ncbi:MAG: MFS transporter [Phycisphaeraceae bacterium]